MGFATAGCNLQAGQAQAVADIPVLGQQDPGAQAGELVLQRGRSAGKVAAVGQVQPQLQLLHMLGVAADQFVGLGQHFLNAVTDDHLAIDVPRPGRNAGRGQGIDRDSGIGTGSGIASAVVTDKIGSGV